MKQAIKLIFDASKFFILFIIAFLISCYIQSCKTCKEAEKIVIIKDSISYIDKIIYDTIRPEPISGPIMWLPNPCSELCDSIGKLKKFNFVTHKNGLTQTLKNVNNVLVQNCDADSLKLVIEKHLITISKLKSEKTKDIIEVNKLKGFNKFLAISGICFWIFILGVCFYYYFKLKRN